MKHGEITNWLPGLKEQVPQTATKQSTKGREEQIRELRRRHRELTFTRLRLIIEPEDPAIRKVITAVEREIAGLEEIIGDPSTLNPIVNLPK